MGKKQKQPQIKNDAKKEDSNIFKTLFGETLDQESASQSIFSNSNPFRRKPTEPNPQTPQTHQELGLLAKDEGDLVNTNGKRKKEKNPNLDLGSNAEEKEVSLVGKKSKSGEIEGNGDLGEVENVGKKKKKRKRDEIEAEYEEKRYGAAKDEGGGDGKVAVVGEKRKKLDNPEDMHITKDGFDDEDKLLRTVFVGNLPLRVKKKALLKEFSQFGEIESVRLRSIPLLDDKTPRKGAIMKKQMNDAVDRVNAYIVFKAEESAQASLSHNMAVIGENHIHVDRACPPRKKLKGENSPLYDNKRTVFIGNLPFDAKDEEIYQLLSGITNLKTNIEAIRIIRDPGTSMGKGIAYVLFKTREAANVLVRKHNLKIRDRELRLSHAAAPNSTPTKRKSPFPSEKYTSPSKKFAGGTTTPDSGNKVKTLSYQGTRASKSGVDKKVAFKKRTFNQVKPEHGSQKVTKKKERTTKRPAVAARRGAASGVTSGSGSVQAGKKRKAGSHTPQSSNRFKKHRKFK